LFIIIMSIMLYTMSIRNITTNSRFYLSLQKAIKSNAI